MTPPPALAGRSRPPALDTACAEAVDLARAAAVEEAGTPDHVGDHLGVTAEHERVATHAFACLDPAYRGWEWAVTVARASRARVVTVDECLLLPGPDALLPPAWVPWSERLRPGDLGVGDLLLTPTDDDRLMPGFATTDPDDLGDLDAALWWELGLGRVRVLSPLGRDDAADRWHSGDRGPAAPIAVAAPGRCATCGFLLLLAGSMRQVFGVCANEYAPDDGRVVSLDHGCGAHSEALAEAAPAPEAAAPVVDEFGYEVVPLDLGVEVAPEAEDLGHS